MNILITGGAGFIGFYLACFHAGRGDNVVILDNFFKSSGRKDPEFEALIARSQVTLIETDLTAPLSIDSDDQFDVVYHLAAINGTKLFYEIPYTVARTNLLATINLLDWLETKQVGRLVYTSTSETYADAEKVGLLKIPSDETTPVVFTQPTKLRFSYGTSKFMGEYLCFAFGHTQKVPTSVVRYHNIYGPRMGFKHVIPEFIVRVRKKEDPFKIYGGEETRAFCYIDDAVQATVAVASSAECSGEIVHIGNADEETRIDLLAKKVMNLLGVDFPLEEHGRRSGSVSRRCPDTSKLNKRTGFQTRISLDEGLHKTIDWYLRQPLDAE